MEPTVSEQITKKSASNLALAFILLPREKREAMAALYAFCREVDDVADEEDEPVDVRRERLEEWREDIRAACADGQPRFPVNREIQPVAHRFGLPVELFEELIRGCEMDLDTKRYQTFEDLDLYCYRVASVVGLLSIEIFGYANPACKDYAVYLGKALQLTNILRDVRTDAELGRIYYNGLGMSKDKEAGAKWFAKAADAGFHFAQQGMGIACFEGEGVKKDLVEAYKWFNLAAAQGNTNAVTNREVVRRQQAEFGLGRAVAVEHCGFDLKALQTAAQEFAHRLVPRRLAVLGVER